MSDTAARANGQVSEPKPAEVGRDAKGKFTAGNPGGPGNPYARQVAALRAHLLKSITAEDLEAHSSGYDISQSMQTE